MRTLLTFAVAAGFAAALGFSAPMSHAAPDNCGLHLQDDHGRSWAVWTNCESVQELVYWENSDKWPRGQRKCIAPGDTQLLDPARVVSNAQVMSNNCDH